MFKLKLTEEVERLISITKSDSGVSGPILAKAHIRLGQLLAEQMTVSAEDTTVVAVMRGGIFMAEGIYFQLGCKFQIYDPKKETFVRPETKNVILVDSVINTGETLKHVIQPDMMVACGVINECAVPYFDNQLFAVRVSQNSFVGRNIKKQAGTVGPDTTMRLFNLI